MTIRITTHQGLKLNFYDVEKIIEKENSFFLQNTAYPFVIGINDIMGTPISTYGIDIHKNYIEKLSVTD